MAPFAAPAPLKAPLLIGNDIFRSSRHAPGHPLAIPRISLAIALCRALGWLPQASYRESRPATADELARFHGTDYIEAVLACELTQTATPEQQRRHNLGVNGNPVYGEVFRRPATACGGSLLAARLIAAGGVVHHPAGGTHHGLKDRASGYCVFNDPVLAILALLDQGLARVAYLDLDAHFGDGVQIAFHDEPRVLTISLHEAGRWPMARGGDGLGGGFGSALDHGGGGARNLPLPAEVNDDEYAFLVEDAVRPLLEAFRPQALVVQAGADALADDPMTRLALSNGALWRVIRVVRDVAPRLLVLGGGGYNPWAVARCWAGIWAILSGQSIPERLPAPAEALLRGVTWRHRLGRQPLGHWVTALADAPRPGPIRAEVRAVARAARA